MTSASATKPCCRGSPLIKAGDRVPRRRNAPSYFRDARSSQAPATRRGSRVHGKASQCFRSRRRTPSYGPPLRLCRVFDSDAEPWRVQKSAPARRASTSPGQSANRPKAEDVPQLIARRHPARSALHAPSTPGIPGLSKPLSRTSAASRNVAHPADTCSSDDQWCSPGQCPC